jgi:hypothetical protein
MDYKVGRIGYSDQVSELAWLRWSFLESEKRPTWVFLEHVESRYFVSKRHIVDLLGFDAFKAESFCRLIPQLVVECAGCTLSPPLGSVPEAEEDPTTVAAVDNPTP